MNTEIKNDRWVQGYVCAVCTLIQLNNEVDKTTRALFKSAIGNMSLKKLQSIGVDGFDLEMLKNNWKELNKKKVL